MLVLREGSRSLHAFDDAVTAPGALHVPAVQAFWVRLQEISTARG